MADLKRELKMRGLTLTGNKNDLVERLQSAMLEGDVFDENALLDDSDDVLNVSKIKENLQTTQIPNELTTFQQDDELLEETKLYLDTPGADEDALLKVSFQDTTKSPSKLAVAASTTDSAESQPTKVVLKRKSTSLIEAAPAASEQTAATTTTTATTTSSDVKRAKIEPIVMTDESNQSNGASTIDADGKTVKLSQLSMKERMELRAKKFGAAPSAESLKAARAERFGAAPATPAAQQPETATDATKTEKTESPAKKAAEPIAKVIAAPDVDVLKKRAERFGYSVSKTMVTMENKEKLIKRQERFGEAAAASTGETGSAGTVAVTKTVTANTNANDDRLKARIERFKATA